MIRSSLYAAGFAIAYLGRSSQLFVDGANVTKHTIETSKEHREKELAAFLNSGKMPDAPIVPKKDSFKKINELQDVPTEVLMKQFIEGGDHIKKHFDASGRKAGTSSPTVAPVFEPTNNTNEEKGKGKVPPPSKSPKDAKGKTKKGKDKSDSLTKVPKEKKKDSKKKKGNKENHASDVPSSSPTPTISPPPAKGDIHLPKNYEVDHENVNSGGDDTSHESDGTEEKERDGAGEKESDGTGEKGRSSNNNNSTDSSSSTSSIAKIVTPIAALAGLFLIGGVWLSRRRKQEEELNHSENIMKHKDGYDVETCTVSGNTYRTGAFTEDDNTLGESVDVHDENHKFKLSRSHSKQMVTVLKDLEEVSLHDDNASTTSVSSGYHSPTNSCDERIIVAARSAMNAEALRPDKSKVYDSSVKPHWATRGSNDSSQASNNAGEVNTGNTYIAPIHSNDPEIDDVSLSTTIYKNPVESDLELEKVDILQDPSEAILQESSVSTDVSLPDEPTKNDIDERPAWMNAKLRPVSQTAAVPKSEVFAVHSTSTDTEPEWMKKFKQMGLEKKE